MPEESLKDKRILLGVSGGIAAYKTPLLVRLLKKAGAEVQVVLTENGARFVTPLTLATVSERPVYTTMWASDEALQQTDIAHISLAEWADLMLVAPATANIIAKLAHGLADDLLSTTLITVTCPVLFCPAMNTNMYLNPMVKANIETLKQHGYRFMAPDAGQLACKTVGPGRMPEPEAIVEEIAGKFFA
jgi:phosphopantothenoylcysteine decarboxylase / phosphopantothenate---cysteine ligase